MEVVNTAPSSQGLLHPNHGQLQVPTSNLFSACVLPAPGLGRGMSMPLPSILRPQCCRVCSSKHPPKWMQHLLQDPAAQGKDGAVVHYPDMTSALQLLQDLPLPESGPLLIGTGTQTQHRFSLLSLPAFQKHPSPVCPQAASTAFKHGASSAQLTCAAGACWGPAGTPSTPCSSMLWVSSGRPTTWAHCMPPEQLDPSDPL